MGTTVNLHRAKGIHTGLIIVVILGTVAFPSTRAAAQDESGAEMQPPIEEPSLAQYVSTDGGWSISYPAPSSTYPAGWTVDDTDPSFVKIGVAPFLVGIHVGTAPLGSTLVSLTDAVLASMGNSFGQRGLEVEVVSQETLPLANVLEATDTLLRHGGGQSRVVVVLAGDRVFLIDAETFEFLWPLVEPDFDTIIRSFTVAAA